MQLKNISLVQFGRRLTFTVIKSHSTVLPIHGMVFQPDFLMLLTIPYVRRNYAVNYDRELSLANSKIQQESWAGRQTSLHDIVLSHRIAAMFIFNITLKSIIVP